MTNQRIICLIDMDCFYVQCEQRLAPDKWGKPCGVAQYNQWKGGGLIAVNYEARAFGIKRGMRGDDCVLLCPEFHTFQVPERNGKAELSRYRNCSAEVFDCIVDYIKELEDDIGKKDLIVFQRASVDEAFIDFTKYIDQKKVSLPEIEHLKSFNCKVKADEEDLDKWYDYIIDNFDESVYRLAMGAYYVGAMRKRVYEKTQFRCSAGISVNKMLAKLACSVNKPNAQTILPFSSVQLFFQNTNISDVRNLGGKAGDHVKEIFNIVTMGELAELSLPTLRGIYDEKQAHWLFMLAKGVDDEPVKAERLSKSIGCGKQFPGAQALSDINKIMEWSKILCEELCERLETDRKTNNRIAKLLTVTYVTPKRGQTSKSLQLKTESNQQYKAAHKLSMEIFRGVFQEMKQFEPILNLAFSVSKFVEISTQSNTIENFFTKIDGPPGLMNERSATDKAENVVPMNEQTIAEENAQPEKCPEPEINKEFEALQKSFFFRKIQQLYEKGELPLLND